MSRGKNSWFYLASPSLTHDTSIDSTLMESCLSMILMDTCDSTDCSGVCYLRVGQGWLKEVWINRGQGQAEIVTGVHIVHGGQP